MGYRRDRHSLHQARLNAKLTQAYLDKHGLTPREPDAVVPRARPKRAATVAEAMDLLLPGSSARLLGTVPSPKHVDTPQPERSVPTVGFLDDAAARVQQARSELTITGLLMTSQKLSEVSGYLHQVGGSSGMVELWEVKLSVIQDHITQAQQLMLALSDDLDRDSATIQQLGGSQF